MTTCAQCETTWTGKRIEHCPECHQTFTGTTSGDMHRTGRHDTSTGPNRRRCLSIEEMETKGMTTNARGHWTTGQHMPSEVYA